MPRHCESALAVAQHLAAHPAVEWVNYPLLPGNRYEPLAQRYLPRGAGGILTFGVKAAVRAAGERFIEAVQFLSHLANVGDAKIAGDPSRRRRRTGSSPRMSNAPLA